MIAEKKIKLKQGKEIVKLTKDGVLFDDGVELKADIVVCATGYSSIRDTVRRVISDDVADRLGSVWGEGMFLQPLFRSATRSLTLSLSHSLSHQRQAGGNPRCRKYNPTRFDSQGRVLISVSPCSGGTRASLASRSPWETCSRLAMLHPLILRYSD